MKKYVGKEKSFINRFQGHLIVLTIDYLQQNQMVRALMFQHYVL